MLAGIVFQLGKYDALYLGTLCIDSLDPVVLSVLVGVFHAAGGILGATPSGSPVQEAVPRRARGLYHHRVPQGTISAGPNDALGGRIVHRDRTSVHSVRS